MMSSLIEMDHATCSLSSTLLSMRMPRAMHGTDLETIERVGPAFLADSKRAPASSSNTVENTGSAFTDRSLQPSSAVRTEAPLEHNGHPILLT